MHYVIAKDRLINLDAVRSIRSDDTGVVVHYTGGNDERFTLVEAHDLLNVARNDALKNAREAAKGLSKGGG